MKIFITGSTGFIGKNLLEYYADHEVFAHTRDLRVTEALYKFKPDVIINCAAEIYTPELMFVPNVLYTFECLEYIRANRTTKMVQIGSSAEYGPMSQASAETDRINPVNLYQASKGASTLLCQGYARDYKLDISIARPYSVYGKYEKPHRLFPRLWRAFKLDQPMTLYQGYHDFIYVDDFVRGIDMLVQRDDKPLGDIVNFGSGQQYSNFEVFDMFKKLTRVNAPVEVVDTMAKSFESTVWICDTTYAKETYGFETAIDLEQGITKFLETANYEQEIV